MFRPIRDVVGMIVGMIIFATCIAAVLFVVALIGALFVSGVSLGERFMIAAGVGATSFAAVLALGWRDHFRRTTTFRAVRRMLLARGDASDEEFKARFSDVDLSLIAQTRQAIAEFFEVPISKIHPTDDFRRDFRIAELDPGLEFSVIYRIFGLRNVELVEPFLISACQPKTIADLAMHIQGLIQGIKVPDRQAESS